MFIGTLVAHGHDRRQRRRALASAAEQRTEDRRVALALAREIVARDVGRLVGGRIGTRSATQDATFASLRKRGPPFRLRSPSARCARRFAALATRSTRAGRRFTLAFAPAREFRVGLQR